MPPSGKRTASPKSGKRGKSPPKSASGSRASRSGPSGGNGIGKHTPGQQKEAITQLGDALVRKYGMDLATVANRRFLDRVWDEITPEKDADIRSKIIPWLDTLGVSPDTGRVLLPMFDPVKLKTGATVVNKTKFIDSVSSRMGGTTSGPGSQGVSAAGSRVGTPPGGSSRRRSGDSLLGSEITNLDVASTASGKKPKAPSGAPRGKKSPNAAARGRKGADSRDGSRSRASSAKSSPGSKSKKMSTSTMKEVIPKKAAAPTPAAPAESPPSKTPRTPPDTDTRDEPEEKKEEEKTGNESTRMGTTSGSEQKATSTFRSPNLPSVFGNTHQGQDGEKDVIGIELHKMTMNSRAMESSQRKILEEIRNMKNESAQIKQRHADLASKLREVINVLEPESAAAKTAEPEKPVALENNKSTYGMFRSGKTPKTGGVMESQKRTNSNQAQSEPSTARGGASAPGTAREGEPSKDTSKEPPEQEGGSKQQAFGGVLPGASTDKAVLEDQSGMLKHLTEMREDLSRLKAELGGEISRREEMEVEKEDKHERMEVAEAHAARVSAERDVQETRARELQRCLEILQEDMDRKTREHERQLMEEQRRIALQQDMQAKCIRLGNILPRHIVMKSYMEDF